MKTLDRLLNSQVMRQAALDYLREHPGAYAPDVCTALGWKASSGASRLAEMAKDLEVRREDAVYIQHWAKGTRRQASFRYWAIATTTRQAVDVIKEMGVNLASSGRDCHEHTDGPYKQKPVDLGKPRYVHNDSRRPALSGQGGQGGVNAPFTATYLEAYA